MKMILDIDRKIALKLAQDLEKREGIHSVSMRYKTKGILEQKE